jgi:hypothetical protein
LDKDSEKLTGSDDEAQPENCLVHNSDMAELLDN